MTEEDKMKKNWKVISICMFTLAAVFLLLGADKKYIYNSPDGYSEPKNAYVGGDAYNYIINACYSTGYYVLSMGFMLGGLISIQLGRQIDKTVSSIAHNSIMKENDNKVVEKEQVNDEEEIRKALAEI